MEAVQRILLLGFGAKVRRQHDAQQVGNAFGILCYLVKGIIVDR